MKIYAITFEYSYSNNLDGGGSPDEAGGIVKLFEDKKDATKHKRVLEAEGEWGDFASRDDNDGWSSAGYILGIEGQTVTPSSKRKS